MRITSMENVKIGDVLGQDIFDHSGCIMLRKGVILTARYIHKLYILGISYLYVLDDRLIDIESPVNEQLDSLKKQLAKSFRAMNKRIDFGLGCDFKDITTVLSDIIDFTASNKDINDVFLGDLRSHDNYTYVHSLNTTLLSIFFGTHKNISKSNTLKLALGAFLHDIGKVDVPLHILNKQSNLTDEEFLIMKNHPIYGYNRSKLFTCLEEETRMIILEHHERVNGSGYPFGKTGDEISLYSKIVSASDVYDALTGDRIYRKAFPHKEAYEHMLSGSGILFDESIISIFQDHFYIYPVGIKVKLSDNSEGFVVQNNKGFPDKPVVRIFVDSYGQSTAPYQINLIEKLNICVEDVIS